MRVLPVGSLLFLWLLPLAAQQTPDAPSASSKSGAHRKAPDPGSVTNGLYRNSWFGFTYKIPLGWVERTEQMQDDSTDPAKSLALLAVFSRPPEFSQEGLNSGVVIVAESAASYPGMKQAADYLDAITQLTTAKGFEVVSDAYEFSVGATKLARVDYEKQKGATNALQTTLALHAKSYFVSFTFIAGSEEEMDGLIAGLQFASAGARSSHPK